MKNLVVLLSSFFVFNIAFCQNDVNLHLPDVSDTTSFWLKNRDGLTIISSIGTITCLSLIDKNKSMVYLGGVFLAGTITLQIPEIKRRHNVKLHRRKK